MGFWVWLVGAADQPHPKISFFRRLRRESGRGFHKASDFVKALMAMTFVLVRRLPSGYNSAALLE